MFIYILKYHLIVAEERSKIIALKRNWYFMKISEAKAEKKMLKS